MPEDLFLSAAQSSVSARLAVLESYSQMGSDIWIAVKTWTLCLRLGYDSICLIYFRPQLGCSFMAAASICLLLRGASSSNITT